LCLVIEYCVLGSSNEEAAEQEELEAMALQKRMVAALREEDFEVTQIPDIKTPTINKSDKKQNNANLVSFSVTLKHLLYLLKFHQEVVIRDLTKLSKDDKLEVPKICVTTGANCLSELLKVNNSLQELYMWSNDIGDEGISCVLLLMLICVCFFCFSH